MKIALVHDYLREAGGAERVLRVLSDMYPSAPIYTAFFRQGTAKRMFSDRKIVESVWAPVLKLGRTHSYLRFVLPWIWKSIDLRAYDLVITSCSGYIARGFRVGDKARVVAYCHTPPKWLYGYETPTGAGGTWWGRAFMWVVGPFVRYFDYRSADRVNHWIANSQEVARRISKFYRKEATVIYPPVEINPKSEILNPKQIQNSKFSSNKQDYYLVVSRLVGAKGIEAAIAGARRARVKLKVVGELVNSDQVRLDQTKDVEYLGRVDDVSLARLYAGAKGFIALARDEDFGMTVVEAMANGTPVLALRSGGYTETVVEGKTGVFVEHVDVKSVAEGIKKMRKTRWDQAVIKTSASRFGRERFEQEIRRIVHARTTRG